MPSINEVYLLGHLARDAEQKFTPSGKSVTNFTVATDHRYRQGDEWKSKVSYHNIVSWELPETVPPLLKKGALVLVTGRLETRNYEKEGRKVYVTEVLSDLVQYIRDANQSGPPQRAMISDKRSDEMGVDLSDLPF